MALPKNGWSDVSSLQLTTSGWTLDPFHPEHSPPGDDEATPREMGPGRHVANLRAWVNGSSCRIEITPKREPRVACRGAGLALERLIDEVGLDQLPRDLFFQAKESQFLPRGLLSLWCLGSAQRRNQILESHTLLSLPQAAKEKYADYEERAVRHAATRLEGYDELEPKTLHLDGVRSLPDGLFFKQDENRLAIVEATMRAPNLPEGAAQILQYVAQARNHPRFSGASISTFLVATDEPPTKGYRDWEELMRDDRELNVYVASSCLA